MGRAISERNLEGSSTQFIFICEEKIMSEQIKPFGVEFFEEVQPAEVSGNRELNTVLLTADLSTSRYVGGSGTMGWVPDTTSDR